MKDKINTEKILIILQSNFKNKIKGYIETWNYIKNVPFWGNLQVKYCVLTIFFNILTIMILLLWVFLNISQYK